MLYIMAHHMIWWTIASKLVEVVEEEKVVLRYCKLPTKFVKCNWPNDELCFQ